MYIYIYMLIYMHINCFRKLVFILKLIAETKEENTLLIGLSALLADLGVPVAEYRTDEAYAMTFWSACEFMHMFSESYDFSFEDSITLLEEIEPFLQAHMAAAGAEFLSTTFQCRNRRFIYPSSDV